MIENSKILERRKSKPNYLSILEDTIQRIKSVIESENSDMLTRYIFEADEDSQDIENAILRALLDCNLLL
jgi:hypothetical protein